MTPEFLATKNPIKTVIYQIRGCNEANNLDLVRNFNMDFVIGDVFRPLKKGCVIDLAKRVLYEKISGLKTNMIENCMVIGRLFILWSAKEMCTKRGLSSYTSNKYHHFDD